MLSSILFGSIHGLALCLQIISMIVEKLSPLSDKAVPLLNLLLFSLLLSSPLTTMWETISPSKATFRFPSYRLYST